jgi:hypothetical protein
LEGQSTPAKRARSLINPDETQAAAEAGPVTDFGGGHVGSGLYLCIDARWLGAALEITHDFRTDPVVTPR